MVYYNHEITNVQASHHNLYTSLTTSKRILEVKLYIRHCRCPWLCNCERKPYLSSSDTRLMKAPRTYKVFLSFPEKSCFE